MSARFPAIFAALVGLCLWSPDATATRQNNAQTISKKDARSIAANTLSYAVSKSLGRAGARRAIGKRSGLLNAVKNHGVKVRMWNLQRGVYSFQAYAMIKTKKGTARKDVKAPFIAGDVDATTGAVTAFTVNNGQVVRGKKFVRQLLPNLREYLRQASPHIE